MDTKTYSEVYETVPKKLTEEQLKAQIVELNRKLENYKLLAAFAQDVVDFWSSMTFRTIRLMIPKMEGLAEALKLINR